MSNSMLLLDAEDHRLSVSCNEEGDDEDSPRPQRVVSLNTKPELSSSLKEPAMGGKKSSFGNFGDFGKSLGRNQSGVRFDLSPEEEKKVTARMSRGQSFSASNRRQTLATAAYMQAQKNQKFLDCGKQEVGLVDENNQLLERFVSGRSSFVTDFTDFRLDRFAYRLREAAATRKAANKLLGTLGKKLRERVEQDESYSVPMPVEDPNSFAAVRKQLGPSAILEQAKRSHVPIVNESYKSMVVPGSEKVRRGGGASRVRALRESVEKTRTDLVTVPDQPASPPVKGGLPALSTHCPAFKYDSIRKGHQHQASTAMESWSKKQRLKTPKEAILRSPKKDTVTVITGTVDYSELMAQQLVMNRELEAGNLKYQQLIDTYDSIQEGIQRKFSMLLKTEFLPGKFKRGPGDDEPEALEQTHDDESTLPPL